MNQGTFGFRMDPVYFVDLNRNSLVGVSLSAADPVAVKRERDRVIAKLKRAGKDYMLQDMSFQQYTQLCATSDVVVALGEV